MAGNAKLSGELAEVDEQIRKVDAEIANLHRTKRELINKKKQIQSRIDSRNAAPAEDTWDRDGFAWSENMNTVLRNTFKLASFRPLQRAVINAVMSKEDAIVILSTGGGKSLCYQLPAVLSEGLTIVVSPLISLIEDQLIQLKKLGIEAATLNQSSSKEEVKRVETAITTKSSSFRLLYVTPEKLAKSKRIMNKLEKSASEGILKLIAIDEVHCCSQWGHDFRPDYKFLNVLKRQFKGVPILGLTATATHHVLEDVKEMLNIPAAVVFRATFNRPNLRYEVVEKPQSDFVPEMAETIKKRFPGQSGIVYCFSRKDCETVTKTLRECGVRAAFYHAYLEPHQRTDIHEKWLTARIHVIVATVAFGMGIDKPDVRFVIHHAMSKSIENYYQESGRAGRDGKPAVCILYYRINDLFRQSTMVCTEKTGGQNLYGMLEYAVKNERCRRVKLAEHFDEPWEPSWCGRTCDVCCGEVEDTLPPFDAAPICKHMVDIIVEQQSGTKASDSGRTTGNKLVELYVKKTKQRREVAERALAELLMARYLQEDFHFTPYSIISYVVPGTRYKQLSAGEKVMVGGDGDGKKSNGAGAVAGGGGVQAAPSASKRVSDAGASSSKKKPRIIDSDDDDDVICL